MRGTLALGFVLLVLASLYFAMSIRGVQQARHQQQQARLFPVEPGAIMAITVDQLGEPPVRAERRDGEWHITEPNETIRPLQLLWDRVALQLSQAQQVREVVKYPGDIAQYGLDQPALRVDVTNGDGETVPLTFGALEPTERFRYARRAGGPVVIVDKNVFFELNRSLEELRHRFLVDNREAPLRYLEFVRIWTGREENPLPDAPEVGTESVRVVLERDAAEAPWRMIEPFDSPANQELAERLASEIQFAVGRNFIDQPEDLRDYGLDPPRARLTVRDAAEGGFQTFELGEVDAAAGGAFVRRLGEDAVFVVDGQVMLELPRTPDALRERRLFSQQATDLRRLRLEHHDHGFSLERNEDGTWRMAAPEVADTDQVSLSNYIASLATANAIAFLPGAPEVYGLDAPEALLVFEIEGAPGPFQIAMIPDPEAEGFYLATQDSGGVVRIPGAQAAALTPHPQAFVSRELLRFNKADARRIVLEFEGTRYVLERLHGRWTVQAPEGMRLQNQADADMILSALTPLQAQGFVPPEDASAPLENPVLTAVVETATEDGAPQTTPMLTIGPPSGDDAQQRVATLAGRDGVFWVSQEVVERVRVGLGGIRAERNS